MAKKGLPTLKDLKVPKKGLLDPALRKGMGTGIPSIKRGQKVPRSIKFKGI